MADLTFEQKITQRIKEQIGDIITDDELLAMVKDGIQKTFFDPRPNPKYGKSGYFHSDEPREIAPLMQEIITNIFASRVDIVVGKWLQENPAAMDKAIKEILEVGLAKTVLGVLDNKMYNAFCQFRGQLEAEGYLNKQ